MILLRKTWKIFKNTHRNRNCEKNVNKSDKMKIRRRRKEDGELIRIISISIEIQY
jgi:hypothetical protein